MSKSINEASEMIILCLIQPMNPNNCMQVMFRMQDGDIGLLLYFISFSHIDYQQYMISIKIQRLVSCVTLMVIIKASELDYTSQYTLKCNNIQNDWTLAQNLNYLWNIVILHAIDSYAYLSLCPVALIFQLLILITFIKNKLLRKSPGDIMFSLVIVEIALNLGLFSNTVYYFIFSYLQPMPDSFPAFCMVISFINTGFSILEQVYMIYFLIHVIFSVQISIKQNKCFEGKMKHIIPLVIALSITMIIWGFGWMGLSQLGICEVTSTRNNYEQLYFPVIKMTFSVFFVVFSFLTYRYFKKNMPQGESLNRRKYQYNEVITRFTIGMSIIIFLFSLASLAMFINCLETNPNPYILIFATIFNMTRIFQFFYLLYVLWHDKRIQKQVKKLLRKLFQKKNAKSSMIIEQKKLTSRQLQQFIDVGIKEQILDIQQQDNKINFIKITQVMTILTGINIAFREYIYKFIIEDKIKSLFFLEEISFQIHPTLIKQYNQQAHILPRLSLLKGRFTMYAPRIFNSLIQMDSIHNIENSFDLIANRNQIYQIVEGDGGKSGQFFFFTSDNKYILKTINKYQFQFLLEELESFYKHFQKYPNTVLAKIYGMFSIKSDEISQKYYFLLMKNISCCKNQQIVRTYDLKGSTDDRQILKGDEQTTHFDVLGRVLKDLDFIKLENKIQIDNMTVKLLRDQINIDTLFLQELNIIDYSLLVMRVFWKQPPKNVNFWGKLQRLESTVFANQYYHFALIDYLQKWDFQKKSEKWWKKLVGKKNVSAQQPSTYQLRFMNFIKNITSCDSNRVSQTGLTSRRQQNNFMDNQSVSIEIEICDPLTKNRNISLYTNQIKQISQRLRSVTKL